MTLLCPGCDVIQEVTIGGMIATHFGRSTGANNEPRVCEASGRDIASFHQRTVTCPVCMRIMPLASNGVVKVHDTHGRVVEGKDLELTHIFCPGSSAYPTPDERGPNWLTMAADEAWGRICAIPEEELGPAGLLLKRTLAGEPAEPAEGVEEIEAVEDPVYDCDLCEDQQVVAKNFGLESTGPMEITACPRCTKSFYDARYETLEDARRDIAHNVLEPRHFECSRDELGAMADRARMLARAAEVYAGVLDALTEHPKIVKL